MTVLFFWAKMFIGQLRLKHKDVFIKDKNLVRYYNMEYIIYAEQKSVD